MGLTTKISIFLLVTVWSLAESVTEHEYQSLPPIYQLDDYDKCLLLEDEPLYCNAQIRLTPADPANPSKFWKTIKELGKSVRNYEHDLLRYGVCLRRTCPNVNVTSGTDLKEQLSSCYTEKFRNFGFRATVEELQWVETKKQRSNLDTVVGIFFAAYAALLIFASFYEGLARYRPEKEYKEITGSPVGRVISAFSIPKNWQRIRPVNPRRDESAVEAIQGMRLFTNLFIISIHLGMAMVASPIANTRFMETLKEHVGIFMKINVVVDVFFVISGWLIAYNFFNDYKGVKRISARRIILHVVNRYIRLTSVVIFIIAFYVTWVVYVADGPNAEKYIRAECQFCRKNWWTHLLHINDYYDLPHQCLLHLWYLAADMKIYTVSLLMLWLMFYRKELANIIMGIALIISVFINGFTHYYYDGDISAAADPKTLYFVTRNDISFQKTYFAGHTHATGYVIGIWFGYMAYKNQKQPLIGQNKIFIYFYYCFCFLLVPFLIYYSDRFEKGKYYPQYATSIYTVATKTCFMFAIAMLIQGSREQLGGIVRKVLEWSPFQVLGRLTYMAYLIHPFFVEYLIGNLRAPIYASDFLMVHTLLSIIILSYIFSMLLFITVELPITTIQGIYLPMKPIPGTKKNK